MHIRPSGAGAQPALRLESTLKPRVTHCPCLFCRHVIDCAVSPSLFCCRPLFVLSPSLFVLFFSELWALPLAEEEGV